MIDWCIYDLPVVVGYPIGNEVMKNQNVSFHLGEQLAVTHSIEYVFFSMHFGVLTLV